jgi:CheY-like chemotaxis protein
MTQKTVLIVDDQKFVRQVVGAALRGTYRVLEAEDGMAAVRVMGETAASLKPPAAGTDLMAAEQHKATIDCIISDINMLPMNGLEFLKAIRLGLTPIRRDTPVIMLTGHAEKQFLATAVALDANGFVVKPVSAKVLQERIERATAERHVVKPAAEYAPLIIPDIEAQDLWSSSATAKRATPPIHASDLAGGQHVAQAVPIADLQVGDRLAEDISTEDGVMVVPGGSLVTTSLRAALKDLSEIVTLKTTVMVVRS